MAVTRPIYPLTNPVRERVPPATSLLNCKSSPDFNIHLKPFNLYGKQRFVVSVADKNQNPSTFTDHKYEKNKYEDFIKTLPQHKNWDGRMLCQYQHFWFPVGDFQGILSCQSNFKAHQTDIILATMPKAGTTWLKALTFSVVNRHRYNPSTGETPLLVSNPHDVVPFLELDAYRSDENPDLESIPAPRIFATHVPYRVLPDSIPGSGCKIIYICRNPLDQFVSHRHFLLRNRFQPDEEPLSLEQAFKMYCDGIHPFGPFWNHMLEYYSAGQEKPDKVLFLKYEELREDVVSSLKKVAEFIGVPFSEEEEKQGVIEEIGTLCSMKNLKSLNVNKEGNWNGVVANSSFFRKGEVGDWKNHLTGSMAKQVEKILEEKLSGFGLTFDSYIKS
ncbi:cytosolic sulfotransferase 15 [Phtheirospermum japonicum]|uniref:Sulfotransferase n=1 Tax=Phtheirospermum japonicum TaxID=374723 RepID=A0A830B529_9LAMI|nr:cytosolic sulfotransferase 15 [Phtheirospermum japonicum]